MKITILICDECDRGHDDDILVSSYRIFVEREMDASGNGYNNNYNYIDLCKECFNKFKIKNPEKEIIKSL